MEFFHCHLKMLKDFIKKNILRTYLLDIGFVVFLGLFLVYAKLRLKGLLVLISTYVPQINAIDPNVNSLAAETLIKDVSNIANTAFIFLIITPVVIFLIYFTFQGLNFYYLNKKRLYLLYFFVTSLITYVLFILLILNELNNWVLILIFLLMAYLTFLSYLQIKGKEYLKLLKRSYLLIFVFLGYITLWLISVSILFMGLLNYSIGENYLVLLILGLLFLFFVSIYRIWFMKTFS